MRKIALIALLALTTSTAFAQHHGYWRHGGDGRWFWMAPMIVGGAVVYEVTRPPVLVQQPPVIIQQNQVINDSNCSPWTEIRNPDGTTTMTRTCR